MNELEAFAAARRPIQDRGATSLQGSVRRALHRLQRENDDWSDALVKAAVRLLRRIYRTEAHRRTSPELRAAVADFIEAATRALNETHAPSKDNFAARTSALALSLANAAINAGSAAAAAPGANKRWVTMMDEAVRPSHRPMQGVTVPMGERFDVAGVSMPYPGWPLAPPELVINCRCTLQIVPAPVSASLSSPQEVAMTETDVMDPQLDDGAQDMTDEVPWHGVLAPEGVLSGDGRKFGIDALRWRDLPLPLSWQKINNEGHTGSVVVGRIDEIWREDSLIKASGTFLEIPEADEAIGLLADGGIRGVSVDVDDATMELEGAADGEPDRAVQVFPDGRICGATLCPIPAFTEAFVRLGDWDSEAIAASGCPCDDEDFAIDERPWSDYPESAYSVEQWHGACLIHLHSGAPTNKSDCKLPVRTPSGTVNRNGVHAAASALAGGRGGVDAPPDAKASAARALRGLYGQLDEEPPDSIAAETDDEEQFAELARGPGWITNPVETRRLHRYWTRGEGAAKIGWGRGGDWNRCRKQLAKYIGPEFLNRTCSQWHFDALGYWPGTHRKLLGHSATTTSLGVRASGLLSTALPALEGSGVERVFAGDVVQPLFAVRARSVAATQVLRAGDDLKVLGVDAGPFTAQVVQIQANGDRAVVTLKRHPVGEQAVPFAVAVRVARSHPDQASIGSTSDHVVELSLGSGQGGAGTLRAPVVALTHAQAQAAWGAVSEGGMGASGIGHTGKSTPQSPSVSLVAAALPVVDARYFANPQFGELTAMAVDDDRRIYGHLAGWRTCHIGLKGTCVTPPHSPSNYAFFHVGAVNTSEGLLPAGRMTMATGHADRFATAAVAMAHYDDTGTVVADIVAGEDEFGIWVSGKLRDETTNKQVAALLQAPPSGDWRDIGGHLEMIHALAVNVPGYPVPRVGIKNGRQRSLAAAGLVMPNEPLRAIDISAAVMAAVDELEARSRRRRMGSVAVSAGRDPASRMAALREKAMTGGVIR